MRVIKYCFVQAEVLMASCALLYFSNGIQPILASNPTLYILPSVQCYSMQAVRISAGHSVHFGESQLQTIRYTPPITPQYRQMRIGAVHQSMAQRNECRIVRVKEVTENGPV